MVGQNLEKVGDYVVNIAIPTSPFWQDIRGMTAAQLGTGLLRNHLKIPFESLGFKKKKNLTLISNMKKVIIRKKNKLDLTL
jgi:hypothetical protein